jgi:HEPN domain-containing protein
MAMDKTKGINQSIECKGADVQVKTYRLEDITELVKSIKERFDDVEEDLYTLCSLQELIENYKQNRCHPKYTLGELAKKIIDARICLEPQPLLNALLAIVEQNLEKSRNSFQVACDNLANFKEIK